MTTTTVELQILPFHNWTEDIRKVKRTFCRFDGVELLHVDPENGIFTIKTEHPEEILDALQRKFAGKTVNILSKRIKHSNPFSALINPLNPSIQDPLNLAEALVAVSGVNGSQNVEYTQSSTIRINFNNHDSYQPTSFGGSSGGRNEEGGYGYVNLPPPPPPPPQQHFQPTTSGSSWRPENVWASSGDDVGYGYVPPPPPPPPPQYQATTSGSARPPENAWGSGSAHNEDYGYGGYVPPRNTSEPSAPLIHTTQGQGYVYGYPVELVEDEYSCLLQHPLIFIIFILCIFLLVSSYTS